VARLIIAAVLLYFVARERMAFENFVLIKFDSLLVMRRRYKRAA